MKRKDWKIKKLIKSTFGKKSREKIKKEKIYFLRKLFLKRNSDLFKKNLFSNYFFYSKLLKNFNFKKCNYLCNNYLLLDNINYNIYNPSFFYFKKLFYLDKNFSKSLNENNLNYIFINKNFKKFNTVKGNNIVVLDDQKLFKSIILKKEETDSFLYIDIKYHNLNNFDYNEYKILDYYFNYHINMLLYLEIYKILIILNINSWSC